MCYADGSAEETQGFIKVVVGGDDDRILGFTMIGSQADELIAATRSRRHDVAIQASVPYPKLRDAVIAHATIAEGFRPHLSNVPPRS